MSYELVRDKIAFDQKIGEESSQLLLEGDLIVPDIKPDMSVILQTDATVRMDKSEASTDRISFIGKLEVQVLYLAKGNDRPVHSMFVVAPIDDFINVEGAEKDMWAEVKADIANIEYKMLNDRKVNYRAVIDISALCERSNDYDVVTNISDVPESQLLKNFVTLNRRVENQAETLPVKDELTLPSGKPNIREILQTSVNVSNRETRVSAGKTSVSGELLLSALYRGDNEANIIEFFEGEAPFNITVETPDGRENMMADAQLWVKRYNITVKPDDDGEDRIFDVEADIGAIVKIHSQENVDVLEDAHCINKNLHIEKHAVKCPRLVCRNKNQTPIKEIVQLSSECPDILQIFMVKAKPYVDDIKIIEDKVIAEGFIEADMLYVAEDDSAPLYSFKSLAPYRQIIETKGAETGMSCDLAANIDHIAFNMLSDREFELRFLLGFNTRVIQAREISVIKDITFDEMPREAIDAMASMTVYVVQAGDSLWKIAKKYNTSIDELALVNEIENQAKIAPGQKLLIIKKAG
ncbi:MAG: DUF3794 domain-containing protein [Clostridiales bacterium]|jgi:hypothetical protein|nr:DUF3794 domain-containing protein [Clostridiales bacterium]